MIRIYTAGIPGAKHIKIRNCAHLMHEEKHARFNDEVNKFLKKEEKEEFAELHRRYQR
jgi:pimeloyl-ACP methyl ester carboxylesterase